MATPLLQLSAPPPPSIISVKKRAESPNLTSIPSNYAYYSNPGETTALDPQDSIPTIDLSSLTSDDPDQKSKAIHNLGKACHEWGFFMVVNHGIPEELMSGVIETSNEFFNLAEEDKPEFEPTNVMDPIRYGTSFNTAKENVFCWRDFLKLFVHPEFHCPDKPLTLRDLVLEYCKRARKVVRILVRGISKSLDLEECELENAMDLDSGLQVFIANFYPSCPNPEAAIGLVPHSDHGLLTLLIQNGVGGLQIQHGGKWINVNAKPNAILVNTGDHLEIFSNGKYKSILHRAVVNNQKTRISIAMPNGPSLDTVVRPASKLVYNEGSAPAYTPMKYREYLLSQQSNQLLHKDMLKIVKPEE